MVLMHTDIGCLWSRTTLAFRLMPRMSATIDCKAVTDAGHVVPKGHGPVPVKTFLETLEAAEKAHANGVDSKIVRYPPFLCFFLVWNPNTNFRF